MRNLHVLLMMVLAAGRIESASVVRLTGGQYYQGLVEMNINGQWRPVCKEMGEYQPTADIVCKMLGYRNAQDYYYVKPNNQSGSLKPFAGVMCTGRESHISKCSSFECYDWFNLQLAVICNNGQVLPNGKPTANQGVAERQVYGVWAGICSYGFSSREADVFCRTLNYKGASWFHYADFGDKKPAYAPHDDKAYICKGDESDINQCSRDVPIEDCNKGFINIKCQNYPDDLQFRLAGGGAPYYGNLEIKYNNTWGSICNSYFTSGIDQICQILKYPRAITSFMNYKQGQKKIWLDTVRCPSFATTVKHCSRESQWGAVTSTCTKDWTAGLICDDPKVKYPDVAVRLVGGSTPNEGRVQVRYKGVWGSILIKKNSRYYLNEAHNVICRMLGYKKVNIKWKVPNSVGPRLLTGLACNGREKTIEQCRHNPWGYVRISSSNPLKEFYIRCQ